MPKPKGKTDRHGKHEPLSTEKLRIQQPSALKSILSTSPGSNPSRQLQQLELVERLPLKLYEDLAAFFTSSNHVGFPALEVLSLSGSSCGDAALLALLPALTHHPKLNTLNVANCCLSDAAGLRVASLIKAQAAAAAQVAWARTLRSGNSPSSCRHSNGSCRRSQKALPNPAFAVCDPGRNAGTLAPAGCAGIHTLDLSCNQLTAAALSALASSLADEHCCIRHLNLSCNPQLPPAHAAAAVLQAALLADPPAHRMAVDLTQPVAPAAAAVAILAGGSRGLSAAGNRTLKAQAMHGPTSSTSSSSRVRGPNGSSVLLGGPSPCSYPATGSGSGNTAAAATVVATRKPSLQGRLSGSSNGGSRKGGASWCAPTDAALQLWSGVFVWEGRTHPRGGVDNSSAAPKPAKSSCLLRDYTACGRPAPSSPKHAIQAEPAAAASLACRPDTAIYFTDAGTSAVHGPCAMAQQSAQGHRHVTQHLSAAAVAGAAAGRKPCTFSGPDTACGMPPGWQESAATATAGNGLADRQQEHQHKLEQEQQLDVSMSAAKPSTHSPHLQQQQQDQDQDLPANTLCVGVATDSSRDCSDEGDGWDAGAAAAAALRVQTLQGLHVDQLGVHLRRYQQWHRQQRSPGQTQLERNNLMRPSSSAAPCQADQQARLNSLSLADTATHNSLRCDTSSCECCCGTEDAWGAAEPQHCRSYDWPEASQLARMHPGAGTVSGPAGAAVGQHRVSQLADHKGKPAVPAAASSSAASSPEAQKQKLLWKQGPANRTKTTFPQHHKQKQKQKQTQKQRQAQKQNKEQQELATCHPCHVSPSLLEASLLPGSDGTSGRALPAELIKLAQAMCILNDSVAQLECLVYGNSM